MTSQIHPPPTTEVFSFEMSWAIIALWWKQTEVPAMKQDLLSIDLSVWSSLVPI